MGKELLRYSSLALAVVLALGIGGCGHSHHSSSNNNGNDNPDDPGNQDEPENVVASLPGTMLLGYADGATVCIDLNRNGQCDAASGETAAEPSATTDGANGQFSISVTDEQRKQIEDAGSARLLALVPAGTVNTVLGKETATDTDLVLSGTVFAPEFVESGKTAETHSVMITPFTTLADSTFDQTKLPSASSVDKAEYEKRINSIAESLGISEGTVLKDYNDPSAATNDSIRAVVADEMVLKMGLVAGSFEQQAMRDAGAVSAETLQGSLANVAINVETVMDVLPENPAGSGDIGAVADALETTTETMAGTFVDLSSGRGEAFRCAVTQLGSVYCWGNNAWANLGDPAAFKDDKGAYHKDGSAVKDLFSYLPVQVRQPDGSPLTGISEVEVGSRFACAVAMDGGVWCWGDNYYGQTGTGKLGDDSRYVYGATRVVAGEQKDGDYLGNVVSISLSRNSACALTISGQAFCWGDNTSKQLGADLPDDNYKAFASVTMTMSDGTSLPQSEEFALKAVPYPVAVAIPGSLGLTTLAAGDWAFCALADVSSASDKHNLFCWGNDSTGLFHNFNDYLPHDDETEDLISTEELQNLQKKYAKVEYYEALSNSSADSSGDYLEEDMNWNCVNDKTGGKVAPSVVNNFARGKNKDALHKFASQRADLSSRDWLIQDSNGDYHPLYSTAVTRIDRAWEIRDYSQDQAKFAEYHTKVTKDDDGNVTGGFRELESLTDVAFGTPEDEKGFTMLLGGYVGSQAHDAELTVGFLTGENGQKYKRWHRLSRGYRYVEGTVSFTCSAQIQGCKGDDNFCLLTKTWDSGYNQYVLSSGQLYNNGRTVVYDTVYEGETGEPEFMKCTYTTKNRRLVIDACQEGIDRFDGEGVYTEDDDTLKISTNAQSTCTLTEPSEDADSNISCSGYNTFGQAGYEPGLIKTCTDSSCQSYKDIPYTGVSYSDYVSAWKWALPKSALIMSLPDTEQAAVRSELLTYFDHFNLGKAWATLSCGVITTDDPLTVDEQNDASCNGVHGDELRNQILENAMTEVRGTDFTYPVVILSGSQDQ